MTEQIDIELDVLESILNEMRAEGNFNTTTLEILRKYQGGYLRNSGIPACQSFNAKFGRALKRQERRLGIREVESKRPDLDDLAGRTTCSVLAL